MEALPTTGIHSATRALGATEKLFWLLDQASQVHFVMAAELSGQTGELSLQHALVALLKSHPLLSCRIVANGFDHPYFEQVPVSAVPLRIVHQRSGDTLATEIARELSMPFDWAAAPLIRCVFINDPVKPVLLFAAHHSVSDGISMTFIIRDLLHALNGERLHAVGLPSSIDQLLELSPAAPAQTHHSIVNGQPVTRRTQSQPNVYLAKIDTALASRILQRSKQEQTSFQGALYAAALSAARAASFPWSDGVIHTVVPVSIRQYITGSESSCLYIGSRLLLSASHEATGFWELARAARREFNNVHDAGILKANAIITRDRLFNSLPVTDLSNALQKGVVREMMLSNIGRIPFPTVVGELTLTNIWGPVALSGTPNELTIGIATVDGTICLTMATRLEAPLFLQSVIAELEKACDC